MADAAANGPVVGGPPFVWIGHDLKSPFPVWSHVRGCHGVCLSAAQVLTKPGYNRAFRTCGITDVLRFKGPVFLDSGGFRFQRMERDEFNYSDVLELYHALRPDMGAVLDFPLDPTASNAVNAARWRRTLANTRRMLDGAGRLKIVPVIHAYDPVSATRRLAELHQTFPRPTMLCIGSLVPLLRGSFIADRFATGAQPSAHAERWATIAAVVTTIKTLEPKIPVHVFGAGSLSTISLLLLLGVNSVDSTGWRMKAAHGAIQLPGLGDRFPMPAKDSLRTRCGLSPTCRELLANCQCPSCSGKPLQRRIRDLAASFPHRAVHNAHVLLSEVGHLGAAIRRGRGAEFVTERFRESPTYRRILEEAVLPELARRRTDEPPASVCHG